jgi:hypothetical protein
MIFFEYILITVTTYNYIMGKRKSTVWKHWTILNLEENFENYSENSEDFSEDS